MLNRLPLAAIAATLFLSAGCHAASVRSASILAGGDVQRGAAAIGHYGCGSCHTIVGIDNAHGLVGPPLTGLRNRMYIAGMLQNTPKNLRHWIREPKSVNPRTAMPALGVSTKDAADIAAYIYSVP